jgi:hypothetical protein
VNGNTRDTIGKFRIPSHERNHAMSGFRHACSALSFRESALCLNAQKRLRRVAPPI